MRAEGDSESGLFVPKATLGVACVSRRRFWEWLVCCAGESMHVHEALVTAVECAREKLHPPPLLDGSYQIGIVARSRRCCDLVKFLAAALGLCEHAAVQRLEHLSSLYAQRVLPAHDPASWTARPCPCVQPCACTHKAQWLAWNAREDAWYRPADLKRIEDTIDLQDPAINGAELLLRCAPSLQHLRDMSTTELTHLPTYGANHVMEAWLWKGYMLAPSSAWHDTGLAGETNPPPVLIKGTKLRIRRKPSAAPMKWVTFGTKSRALPLAPDSIAQQLGLPWDKRNGFVVRIEIPLDKLRQVNARFVLPTFFDGLGYRPSRPLETEWRARPATEHRADEPWGHARDMIQDGPGLPEVLVDITQAGEMVAECLDKLQADWSSRPYLQRSAPR